MNYLIDFESVYGRNYWYWRDW